MKIHKVLFIAMALLAIQPTICTGNRTEQEQVQEGESLILRMEDPISSQFEYLTSNSGNYNANGIRYEVG